MSFNLHGVYMQAFMMFNSVGSCVHSLCGKTCTSTVSAIEVAMHLCHWQCTDF